MSVFERLWNLFLARIPTTLPRDPADFDGFCNSIFDLYGLPKGRSYTNAIASLVMHLPATQHKKPKHFFAAAVKKMMANEAAYQAIEKIRADEKAEREAAASVAAQNVVTTSDLKVVSN